MENNSLGLNFVNIINKNNNTESEYLSIDCDITLAILMMKILNPYIKFVKVSEYKEKYKNRLHPQITNLLCNRGWEPYSSHCGKYNIRDNWSGHITFEGIDDNAEGLENFMGPSPEKLRFWFQTQFYSDISSYISQLPDGSEKFYKIKLQKIYKKLSSRDSITTLLNSINDVLINNIYNY